MLAAVAIGAALVVIVLLLARLANLSLDFIEGLARIAAFIEGETSLSTAGAYDILLVLIIVISVLASSLFTRIFNAFVGAIRWVFSVLAQREDPALPLLHKPSVPLKYSIFAIFMLALSRVAIGL